MDNPTSIISMLGGVDKISGEFNIVEVIGGFDKDLNLSYNNIVTGDITKTFLKNRITEWESFKEIYYEKNKLDKKYYDKFIAMLNNIFILPFYFDDEKKILNAVYSIYNASNSQIYIAMSNTLDLLNPIKLILKHLFMNYKVFIEKLIEVYVILRNDYIKKNNIQNQNKYNNFDLLINNWIDIDMKNKTNTSSVILFFNFPPKYIKLEKSIKKIEWEIKGVDEDIRTIINKFMNELKSNNFYYCGFCPYVPLERLELLSKFPIDTFIKMIILLNISNNKLKTKDQPVVIDIEIINQIEQNIKHLNQLNEDIVKINDIHISKLTKHKIKKCEPINKAEYIAIFEKYIYAYLDLYEQIAPIFIEKEKLLNNMMTKINTISKNISSLTHKIILKK